MSDSPVAPKTLCGLIIGGRYRLATYLDSGTYGWVYAADEVVLDEVIGQVAVKLLRPRDDEARRAIIREAQTMRQLTHHNLLVCYAAGVVEDAQAAGCLFIVTELGSESLEARLKQLPMTTDEVREVAQNMASALVYLCERGAVHRDMKPANILRVGSVWKLGDFGLVRGFAGTGMQASGRKGTVRYMSPEAMHGETGPFVDVWALGAVIQECLTGALPYSGNSDTEIIAAALTRDPSISPRLPEPFGPIVRGCLMKDRRSRWTARQVRDALRSPQRSAKTVHLPEATRVGGGGVADPAAVLSEAGLRALLARPSPPPRPTPKSSASVVAPREAQKQAGDQRKVVVPVVLKPLVLEPLVLQPRPLSSAPPEADAERGAPTEARKSHLSGPSPVKTVVTSPRTAAPGQARGALAQGRVQRPQSLRGWLPKLYRWLFGEDPRGPKANTRPIESWGLTIPASWENALASVGAACGATLMVWVLRPSFPIPLTPGRFLGALILIGSWAPAYLLIGDVWDARSVSYARFRAAAWSGVGALLGVVSCGRLLGLW